MFFSLYNGVIRTVFDHSITMTKTILLTEETIIYLALSIGGFKYFLLYGNLSIINKILKTTEPL